MALLISRTGFVSSTPYRPRSPPLPQPSTPLAQVLSLVAGNIGEYRHGQRLLEQSDKP